MLIPDTIRSGLPLSTCVIARLTQSVGVPSIGEDVRANRIDAKRTTKRERVADGARLLNRGDGRHVAERGEHGGQGLDPFRVHTIVIGHENSGHWNH